jgi:hypothetical protein
MAEFAFEAEVLRLSKQEEEERKRSQAEDEEALAEVFRLSGLEGEERKRKQEENEKAMEASLAQSLLEQGKPLQPSVGSTGTAQDEEADSEERQFEQDMKEAQRQSLFESKSQNILPLTTSGGSCSSSSFFSF